MDTLEQARAEIDAVDAQLAALFERADGRCAQRRSSQTGPRPADFDAAREAAVLEKGCGLHPKHPPALL